MHSSIIYNVSAVYHLSLHQVQKPRAEYSCKLAIVVILLIRKLSFHLCRAEHFGMSYSGSTIRVQQRQRLSLRTHVISFLSKLEYPG